MFAHPGDYDLVIYKGRLHRAERGSGLPRVIKLGYLSKAIHLPKESVYDEDGLLKLRFWSLKRVKEYEFGGVS
jgi:hypothetical protein